MQNLMIIRFLYLYLKNKYRYSKVSYWFSKKENLHVSLFDELREIII